MFCIQIYRRSPSAYNFIFNYLSCPSATTLHTQLKDTILTPGCNNTIAQYLKLVAKEVTNKDLYCSLIWDEMTIEPAVHHNFKIDGVTGFEDWGMRRTRKFTDHAIVFYMKCLYSGKHMPLDYGFCENTTSTVQLVRCIRQWLNTLVKCGFHPVATVCDQGATNVAAINFLVTEANQKTNLIQKNRSK